MQIFLFSASVDSARLNDLEHRIRAKIPDVQIVSRMEEVTKALPKTPGGNTELACILFPVVLNAPASLDRMVAIETMRSRDAGAFNTTGNRMQASSVLPPGVFGRALVTSSIRLTICTSGIFALMRCSRSFNRAESTLALNKKICIVQESRPAHIQHHRLPKYRRSQPSQQAKSGPCPRQRQVVLKSSRLNVLA